MKPESIFRRRVLKWIKDNLQNVDVTPIQQLAFVGDPDLVLCLNGQYVALELKSEGGKASALQEHKLLSIRQRGKGRAFVVDPTNWTHVQNILRRIDEGELL